MPYIRGTFGFLLLGKPAKLEELSLKLLIVRVVLCPLFFRLWNIGIEKFLTGGEEGGLKGGHLLLALGLSLFEDLAEPVERRSCNIQERRRRRRRRRMENGG